MAQVISNLGSARHHAHRRNSYLGEGLVALFNRIQDWSERRRAR